MRSRCRAYYRFTRDFFLSQRKRAYSAIALIFIHEQNRRKRDRTNRVKFYLRRSLKAERNYHRPISDRNHQCFMLSRGILGHFNYTAALRRKILSSSNLRAVHIGLANTRARLFSDLAGVCFRGL